MWALLAAALAAPAPAHAQNRLVVEYTTSTVTVEASPTGKTSGDSGLELEVLPTILLAHILFGALATLLFLPLGAVLPRIARTFTKRRWWFPVHSAVQGFIGTGLVIATYACVHYLIGDLELDTTHKRMGFAMLILVVLQSILGIVVHWFNVLKKNAKGRSPFNYLHMTLGGAVVALGWATVWAALWDEEELTHFVHPGWTPWRTAWIVVVVCWVLVFVGAYLTSVVFRKNTGKS